MGHKAFKRAANLDPVWFTLPGEGDSEVRFDCQPDLSAGLLMSFEDGAQDPEASQMAAVREFFNAAVVESQQEQFWAMINDRKAPIGISILVEVAQWLAGEYADRPTGQSSASGSQRTTTSGPSTDGASPAVKTYSKPELAVL